MMGDQVLAVRTPQRLWDFSLDIALQPGRKDHALGAKPAGTLLSAVAQCQQQTQLAVGNYG